MSEARRESVFDDVAATYYRAWFRYHPEQALEVGESGFVDRLAPFDEEAAATLVCLNNELLVSLNAIEREQLDPDRRLDYDVLYGAAWLESEYLTEVRPYRLDPGQMLPVNALYQLLIYDIPRFAESLEARLAAIPGHLERAEAYLRGKAERVPRLWAESAIASARGGIALLRDLPHHPKCEGLALASLLQDAEAALERYARFLQAEIVEAARGDFACGRPYFDKLLEYRHFLGVDADALHAFGVSLFERTEKELKAAAREIAGNEDLHAIARRIQADHPGVDALLAAYRRNMAGARRLLEACKVVTLPARECIEVIETPVFMRHLVPFAAYHAPSPSDPAQRGYFYVTPPEDDEQLAEHNHPGLALTCVHEAYPGHHLQFVTANLRPAARSLPRLLNTSATLYEGWALYCEQLMLEQGFLDRPEQRFLMLKDRLWRALRIILDVELHTRGLSIEEAVERMSKHLGFPRSQALADLRWYTQSPTVPMGYATGWALINAARTRACAREARELQHFHDTLLAAGSMALPLALKSGFGDAFWAEVSKSVFGEARHAAA